MKKPWIVSSILAALAVVVLGFYLNRDRGRAVVVDIEPPGPPKRIVSLAPNLTEILFALGLGEQVVAISSDSDYPPEAAPLETIGTFWQPNTEAVIAARPDLVVTLSFGQQQSVAQTLKRLGVDVLMLKIRTVGEFFVAVEQIGEATACRQRAKALVAEIVEQMSGLQSKLGPARTARVLWVVQAEPLRAAGRSTFVNELIELAGGENAIGPTVQQYPQIGTEELLACGAETIIQSAMGTDDLADEQQAAEAFWQRFENLPAVKNNRIYVVQPDTVLRLSPRLPEGIELIAQCLHPKLFARTDDAEQEKP
jgi:iron complex transport system substrate-binding protein